MLRTYPRLALAQAGVLEPSGFEQLLVPMAYAAIGFTPIGALTLSIAGVLPLSAGAVLLVGLSLATTAILAYQFPASARLALDGFAAGLLAVLVYDAARWISIGLGWWGDFIPEIGGWLLGTNQPNVVLGYTYRWLGDGGGMGLAFLVAARMLLPTLPRSRAILLGILYGIAIWGCLVATLVVIPNGQESLFVLTPTTFALSLAGHLIYGGVLGAWLAVRQRSDYTR